MASSLRLPQAAELSGLWVLSSGEKQCELQLKTAVLDGTTWQLTADAECVRHLLPGVPQGWRPTPDGLTLTQQDGSAVAFFSRQQASYEYRLADGSLRTLKKKI